MIYVHLPLIATTKRKGSTILIKRRISILDMNINSETYLILYDKKLDFKYRITLVLVKPLNQISALNFEITYCKINIMQQCLRFSYLLLSLLYLSLFLSKISYI